MPEVSKTQGNTFHLGGQGVVVTIGYSARALAQATVEWGMPVVAVDCFTDRDLSLIADFVIQLQSWGSVAARPNFVREIVRKLRALELQHGLHVQGVLLAGGSENWLELVKELARNFPVLGADPIQLRTLRSWKQCRQWACRVGMEFPTSSVRPLVSGNSLAKMSNGAGGSHIVRTPEPACSAVFPRVPQESRASDACYFQQEIQGRSLGVVCILRKLSDSSSDCQILGAVRAWDSREWAAATEFIYRGSWGPVRLADSQRTKIRNLGVVIAEQTGLQGWIQFDFIEDAQLRLWLLEINPRWTAGMEVLVQAGLNPVPRHWHAWRSTPSAFAGPRPSRSNSEFFGKAILYAKQDVHMTDPRIAALHGWPQDRVADVPSAAMIGSVIPQGHPILTLKAAYEAHAQTTNSRESVDESVDTSKPTSMELEQQARRRLLVTLQQDAQQIEEILFD